MNVVLSILRYLKVATKKRILFIKNINCQSIDVYTNPDKAGVVNNR